MIMPRPKRFTPGGFVYHVCNRGSRKGVLFETYEDYALFLHLSIRAAARTGMRIIAYCLMQTHFHLLLWPVGDRDLPSFMQRLTTAHAMRWHRARGTVGTGAVYQSRYVSVGIADGMHYFTALRYVERNALAAGLVKAAEDWPWTSAANAPECAPELCPGPLLRPTNWADVLNAQ
jgi:putative transposase